MSLRKLLTLSLIFAGLQTSVLTVHAPDLQYQTSNNTYDKSCSTLAIDHLLRFLQAWNLDSKSPATLKGINSLNAIFKGVSVSKMFFPNGITQSPEFPQLLLSTALIHTPAALSLPTDIDMVRQANKLAMLNQPYGKGKKFGLIILGLAVAAAHYGSFSCENPENKNISAVVAAATNWLHRYLLRNAQNSRLKLLQAQPINDDLGDDHSDGIANNDNGDNFDNFDDEDDRV